ncbi:ABC transporter ATP-binding protein [Bacillus solimangrovi]|uniref:ABC transporter domain-containing protein n=1 Tax=Bacillus solimangrovi TaxID=1305675 RepID=A0A1E5LK69_9BACI|nr:ABC transporter ATP-binding protein [Bacillus solimangrovi]OEH94418.1 hypothetical protein BFG57_08125 [Bacillus solimangrovi]
MLLVNNVVKEYSKGVKANDQISLSVNPGEIFGLLGPNGAGKTTLVSQIIGSMKPSSGTITIDGVDIVSNPQQARKLCTMQPQSQVSIEGLTPKQAIELAGRMRKGDRHKVAQRTDYLLKELNIEPWANKMATNLSGGIKRLVIFCMTVVVPGKLVILDEPTNDIDPVRRRLLWNQIRLLAENGVAVLIVTHNVIESEQFIDRLAIISEGEVLASGTPSQLKRDLEGNLRLQLVIQPEHSIPPIPDFANITMHSGARVFLSIPQAFVSEAVQWVEHLRLTNEIEEYTLSPITLEDAYFKWIKPQEKMENQEVTDNVV